MKSVTSVECWDILSPGDILHGDRLMANWANLVMIQQRGLERVNGLNKANRKEDFRKGKRLGKDHHGVQWRKPSKIRSLDWKTYHSLPNLVSVQEKLIRTDRAGFRSQRIIVVTTLLDPEQTTK